MAIMIHVEIVLQSSDAIEQWETENSDIQLDFSNANLRRADLTNSNLSGTNLEWADFRWANLYGCRSYRGKTCTSRFS